MATGEIQTYEDVGTAAGYTRTYLSTKGPYRDLHGNVIGLIGISRDITERKLADRRGIAEHAVTCVLAESADLREATPKIIQAICASLGWDLGVLWQVDRQAGALRCLEVWREPGIGAAGFERLCRQITFAPGVGLPGRVWHSGEPVWIANVVEDTNFPRLKAARLAGLHAGFAFPVSNGKEFLGVLEFFSREIREPEEALLAMMDSISSQIGQFIERRQAEKALHKREGELGLARQIQQGLLPRTAPALDGFDMDGVSLPAQETGGDYLDFIPAEDGRLGIAIGDASGHGIAAALLMAETRAYLRALLLSHADAGRILSLANRNVVKDIERDWFVTLFLAFLDPRARTLVSCGAGHNPAYVLNSRGEVKTILTSVAMPLGIEAGTAYVAGPAVQLESGDLVFLYTDGIIEACPPGSARFGIERALGLIRAQRHEPARQIVDALLQSVRGYCGTAPSDDMTAIILKVV
jgi:serine phosphatase RsbU (regulator of sigma subunit)